MYCKILAALLLATPFSAFTAPQSNQASEASALSLELSGEASEATALALSAGGRFVVKSLEASGETVVLVLEKVGTGVSHVVRVSSRAVVGTGLVVSGTVVVSVVLGGYLLSHEGRVFAFVPDPRVRKMIHSQEIG